MIDDVKGSEDAKAAAGVDAEKELEREREIGVGEGFVFDRRASSSANFLCLGSAAFSFSFICAFNTVSSSRIRTST